MINTISITRVLLLSPQLSELQMAHLNKRFNTLKELNLSLNTALELGLLPPPKIFLIGLTLDNSRATQSFKIITGVPSVRKHIRVQFKNRFQFLGKHKNLHLTVRCTEQQKYDYLMNELDRRKDSHANYQTAWSKIAMLRTGLKRKQFLSQIKTPFVQQFLDTIRDKRFICFTSSINQCERLGNDTNIIHSSKKSNSVVLEMFNKKKINSLFVVNMLTEGTNLTDVNVGIIIQLDIQERRYIQKSGRIYLGEYPEQYVFYYKNTKDEQLVHQMIKKKFDPKYIFDVSFDKLISKTNGNL